MKPLTQRICNGPCGPINALGNFRPEPRRLEQVGIGAFGIVTGVTFFAGAAFCQQAAFQAQALLGDQSFIGPEYIVLAFKSFGPLVVALALMSKVGAAFAAELALMRQNQSLEALVLYRQSPGARRFAPMGLALTFGAVGLGLLAALSREDAGIVVMYAFTGYSPKASLDRTPYPKAWCSCVA